MKFGTLIEHMMTLSSSQSDIIFKVKLGVICPQMTLSLILKLMHDLGCPWYHLKEHLLFCKCVKFHVTQPMRSIDLWIFGKNSQIQNGGKYRCFSLFTPLMTSSRREILLACGLVRFVQKFIINSKWRKNIDIFHVEPS